MLVDDRLPVHRCQGSDSSVQQIMSSLDCVVRSVLPTLSADRLDDSARSSDIGEQAGLASVRWATGRNMLADVRSTRDQRHQPDSSGSTPALQAWMSPPESRLDVAASSRSRWLTLARSSKTKVFVGSPEVRRSDKRRGTVVCRTRSRPTGPSSDGRHQRASGYVRRRSPPRLSDAPARSSRSCDESLLLAAMSASIRAVSRSR